MTSVPQGELRKKSRVYAPFLPQFATAARSAAFTVVEEAYGR